MAALKNSQKSALAQVARRAFNRQRALALGRGEAWTHQDDEWRHAEVMKAVGKAGLRCCVNDDFESIMAHFLDLAGESGQAMEYAIKEANRDCVRAQFVLVKTMKEAGLKPAYVDKICLTQNKCQVQDMNDPKKIWALVYTIKNRGAAKRRKEAK